MLERVAHKGVLQVGPPQDLVPVPRDVVALLRMPIPIDGLLQTVRGLQKLYRDNDLEVRTDLQTTEGWMVIAHPAPEGSES